MDPRDQARADDVVCSVCREPVGRDRMRLLARREDLVFVELRCAACASLTLGILFADVGDPLPDAIRLAGAPSVTLDDVRDMRRHLERWQGDLRSLLDGDPTTSPGGVG